VLEEVGEVELHDPRLEHVLIRREPAWNPSAFRGVGVV
jgi:hypothetical protein